MSSRGDEQMAVVVGIAVENGDGVRATIDDEQAAVDICVPVIRGRVAARKQLRSAPFGQSSGSGNGAASAASAPVTYPSRQGAQIRSTFTAMNLLGARLGGQNSGVGNVRLRSAWCKASCFARVGLRLCGAPLEHPDEHDRQHDCGQEKHHGNFHLGAAASLRGGSRGWMQGPERTRRARVKSNTGAAAAGPTEGTGGGISSVGGKPVDSVDDSATEINTDGELTSVEGSLSRSSGNVADGGASVVPFASLSSGITNFAPQLGQMPRLPAKMLLDVEFVPVGTRESNSHGTAVGAGSKKSRDTGDAPRQMRRQCPYASTGRLYFPS